MPLLPITKNSPVLRTDFENETAWKSIRDEIRRPSPEGFLAYVDFIEDRAFDRLTIQQLVASVPKDYPHSFIIVVDQEAVTDPENPLHVVNLYDGLDSYVGDEFRAIPSAIQAIENNLSLANMDFIEFKDAAGADRIFRGF